MEQVRITNISKLKAALQTIHIADKPKLWVSLRQNNDLTLTYLETDNDGFEGLSVRMPEDECIHAFILIRGIQFKTSAQVWAHSSVRPSRQCATVQLCFVGKESGISRAAAHQAHHSRALSAVTDCVAFGLMSDNVFDLSALIDTVSKEKGFHPPGYLSVVPGKGCFNVSGSPNSPFPIYMTSFMTVQNSVRINVDPLSTTNLLTYAFKMVSEIKHFKRHQGHINLATKQLPGLLPQIDTTHKDPNTFNKKTMQHIHAVKKQSKDSPPSPPTAAPAGGVSAQKGKYHLAQLQHDPKLNMHIVSVSPITSPLKEAGEKTASLPVTIATNNNEENATVEASGLKGCQIKHIYSVLMNDTSYLDDLALPSSTELAKDKEYNEEKDQGEIAIGLLDNTESDRLLPPMFQNLAPRPVRPRSLLIRRFTQTEHKVGPGNEGNNVVKLAKHERSHSSSSVSVTQLNSPISHQKIASCEELNISLFNSLSYGDSQPTPYSSNRDKQTSRGAMRSRSILSRPSSTVTGPNDIEAIMQNINKLYRSSCDQIVQSITSNPASIVPKDRSDAAESADKLSTDDDRSNIVSAKSIDQQRSSVSSGISNVQMVANPVGAATPLLQPGMLKITKYKPALNQLVIEIASLSKTYELNKQLQFALQSFQSAIFDTVSAINHEINPEHRSICIFEEKWSPNNNSSQDPTPPVREIKHDVSKPNRLEESLINLREKLIRVAMTLVVNIATDKGLIYSDISRMINAVSIFLPQKGLGLLRKIILQPIPLDLEVLIAEGFNLIDFCNKI